MPSIGFGFKVGANGARLPYTTIQVGSRTLSFCGRPGPRLVDAVEHLERLEAAEAARLALLPSDIRD